MKTSDHIVRAREAVKTARDYPALFIGSLCNGHLVVILEPLRVSCMTPAFYAPKKAKVTVDGHKFWLRVWSDGLCDRYGRMVEWESEKSLWEAIGKLGKDTCEELSTTAYERVESQVSLSSLILSVIPARSAIVGLHARGRFWWQTFTAGIPDGDIQSSDLITVNGHSPLGLCIGADLDPEFFPNLPYRVDEVRMFLSCISGCPLEVVADRIGDMFEVIPKAG